ncbi:MAG: hypothetical protein PVG71_14180 [Anaerolineae bacterium]
MNDRSSASIVYFPHPRYSFVLNGMIPRAAEADRGQPASLWLALKIRGNMLSWWLSGSLVALSQRESYTGPLAHWMEGAGRGRE